MIFVLVYVNDRNLVFDKRIEYALDIVLLDARPQKPANKMERGIMMQILYSSLHNLDMNQDDPIRKQIPFDFGSFIEKF